MIHIRSFSKSHRPDLRIAAVGGPVGHLDAFVRRRQLGGSWTSRILQNVLVELLDDTDSIDSVRRASEIYRERRDRLGSALSDVGIQLNAGDGLNFWVPVADEQAAVVALAAVGVGVAPGSPFQVNSGSVAQIRVTLPTGDVDFGALAESVSSAASLRASIVRGR